MNFERLSGPRNSALEGADYCSASTKRLRTTTNRAAAPAKIIAKPAMLIGPEFAPVLAIWLVVLEPVVEEPVVLEPLVLEPVVLDPVVEEPVVPEPVVEAAVVEDVSPALVVDEVSPAAVVSLEPPSPEAVTEIKVASPVGEQDSVAP